MAGITSPYPLSSRLLRVQAGQETTWGSPVIATSRFMAVQPYPQFKPYVKTTIFDEDRGSLVNAFLSAQLQQGGTYTMNFHATYEDILYRQLSAVQSVAPTGVGPYTWTSVGPTTSAWPVNSYTMEWGYDIGTIQLSGCLIDKYTVKGAPLKQWEEQITGFFQQVNYNDAINISSSTNATPIVITTATAHGYATGNQVIIANHLINTAANGTWTIVVTGANTFSLTGSTGNGIGVATGTSTRIQTPAIADRTVEVITTPGTALYMDPAATTPGTTPMTNVLMNFQLDISTGLTPVWTGDFKYPIAWVYEKYTPVLSLSMLYTSAVKSFIDTNLHGSGSAVVRLQKVSGAKSATIDFSGVMTDDPAFFTDSKGAVQVDIKLEGQYDSGALANQLKFTTVNNVATLP